MNWSDLARESSTRTLRAFGERGELRGGAGRMFRLPNAVPEPVKEKVTEEVFHKIVNNEVKQMLDKAGRVSKFTPWKLSPVLCLEIAIALFVIGYAVGMAHGIKLGKLGRKK